MRPIRGSIAMLALLVPLAAAHAAALVITKTSVIVTDTISIANPKALPGASIDYSLMVANPNGLLSGQTFTLVTIKDDIPANTVFNAADYGATGRGPIEFTDGGLLGLLTSGVSLQFKGLDDDGDGVEFWNGVTWRYHPANGYDPNVKAIRVTMTGTQAVASSFRLRFRVKVI